MQVLITPSAKRQLESLPEKTRIRIDTRILSLAENPRPQEKAFQGYMRRIAEHQCRRSFRFNRQWVIRLRHNTPGTWIPLS